MRIQHNIPAMNSYRNYTANTKAVSKNLEKLSSGYRINRAGDDAAGLAISEKMRAQVTGLKTAQRNAKDGISLIQTAEGALTEVHSMLNRMVELADQSANGTFDDTTDRANLQKELTQLKSEVDRIADSTNFNGIKLLNGDLAGKMDKLAGEMVKGQQKLEGFTGNLTNEAATTGKYAVKLDLDSAKTDGTTAVITGSTQIEVVLTDSNNKDYTLKLKFDTAGTITAEALNDALVLALGGGLAGANAQFEADNKAVLDELGKVFSDLKFEKNIGDPLIKDILDITAESKATGSDAVGLKSVTLKQREILSDGSIGADLAYTGSTITDLGTSTTQVAKDAYSALTPDNLGVEGTKYTVGDHTFELAAADNYKVSEGSVRVIMGKDDAETLKNLVAAMKSSGISSASIAPDTGKIKIGDINQLKTADKEVKYNSLVDIKTGSLGMTVGNVDELNAEVTAAQVAGGDGTKQTIAIGYTDASGKDQVIKVDYTASTTAADNMKAIADAINSNADAKKLFKASVGADVGAEFKLESLGGTNGVTIRSIATDDTTGAIGALDKTNNTAKAAGKSVSFTNTAIAEGDIVSVGGKDYQFVTSANLADKDFKLKDGAQTVLIGTDNDATAANFQAALSANGIKGEVDNNTVTIYDGESKGPTGGGLTLQIGDTSDSFNRLTVSINDMHAKNLGIADIDIGNQDDAAAAVEVIKSAINSVSATRGDLGAAQNRLDHTINNLSVMTENIQDAESSIRDVDVADEMMAYTKNNILVQSAQAMLAQANQLPQGVLQLLG